MYVSQDLMWRKILKKNFVSRRTTRPQWSSTSPTNNQIPQKEIYHKARYRPSDPARPAGRLWVVAEAHGGGDAGRQKKAMSGVSTNSLLLGVAIRRFQGGASFCRVRFTACLVCACAGPSMPYVHAWTAMECRPRGALVRYRGWLATWQYSFGLVSPSVTSGRLIMFLRLVYWCARVPYIPVHDNANSNGVDRRNGRVQRTKARHRHFTVVS